MRALTMMKLTTILLAACVVILNAATAIAQEPEPISIQCQGKAVSPELPHGVSLTATIDRDRELDLVLIDSLTHQQESPFRLGMYGDVMSGTVSVRTGSLTVDRGKNLAKLGLKMLWQSANMDHDFIGFAITDFYTDVLKVFSFDSEKMAFIRTEMPFSFFDGEAIVLYRGTCAAH